MTRRNSIVLIGYRGTGKTTVAKLLAERLGWEWVDADAYLEEQHGRTIQDIFQTDGEAVFRDMEAKVLSEICNRERLVLATGGGVVLRAENRQRLREAGRIVWLTADAGTIFQRLQLDSDSGAHRPPLTALSGLAEIDKLLDEREPLYADCADLVINTAAYRPEQVTQLILSTFGMR